MLKQLCFCVMFVVSVGFYSVVQACCQGVCYDDDTVLCLGEKLLNDYENGKSLFGIAQLKCSINPTKNPAFGDYDSLDKDTRYLKEKVEYHACIYYVERIQDGIDEMNEALHFGSVENVVRDTEELLSLSGLTWQKFGLSDEMIKTYLLKGYMNEIGCLKRIISDATTIRELAEAGEFLKMFEKKHKKLSLETKVTP